jgi:hypothetical protein
MVLDKTAQLDAECHEIAYEVLKSTASWLENPDNELFSLLEEHEPSIEIAARACITAAEVLKKASLDIQLVSGIQEQKQDVVTALDKLRALANEFDESGDPSLMKKASLLDEILLTVAADVEEQSRFRAKMNNKIAEIKKRSQYMKDIKTATEPTSKAQNTSEPHGKIYEENEASLSTRYCPDHPGESVFRKGDNIVQCPLDGKTYDFKDGFTTAKGNKIPGTSVENQTKLDSHVSNPLATEETRESRQSG